MKTKDQKIYDMRIALEEFSKRKFKNKKLKKRKIEIIRICEKHFCNFIANKNTANKYKLENITDAFYSNLRRFKKYKNSLRKFKFLYETIEINIFFALALLIISSFAVPQYIMYFFGF